MMKRPVNRWNNFVLSPLRSKEMKRAINCAMKVRFQYSEYFDSDFGSSSTIDLKVIQQPNTRDAHHFHGANCSTNLLSIFRFLCVFWILPFVILAWSRHQSILICNQHSHKTSHSGAKFIMCASFKNRNRITNSTFCGKFHFLVEPNLCAYFYEFNIILVLEC